MPPNRPGSTIARFEALLRKRPADRYVLRLYVTGATRQSTRAVANLKTLCETHLRGRYELTVVDLYHQPEEARAGDVVAAPTLVKERPLPARRLVGTLADTKRVLAQLGLSASEARGKP
jgi:circadian clock protein KaiB